MAIFFLLFAFKLFVIYFIVVFSMHVWIVEKVDIMIAFYAVYDGVYEKVVGKRAKRGYTHL